MSRIIDGKALSLNLQEEMKAEVDQMIASGRRAPHLVAVLVGEDGPSKTYVGHKVRMCDKIGFKSTLIEKSADISEEELHQVIQKLNEDPAVDGYIVQLPLPPHINAQKITLAIDPKKDVDGFHPINFGKMAQHLPCYLPATPYGIMLLLERNGIETSGKHAVVIGRSQIVGTPVSILLSRSANPGNCTVTLCHSRTKDLTAQLLQADIIVAAIGRPNFVKADMVKKGAVVIDVGINRFPDDSKKRGYRLVGDVDFENVAPKCSWITPVPGGVGPMTVTALLMNTLKARKGI